MVFYNLGRFPEGPGYRYNLLAIKEIAKRIFTTILNADTIVELLNKLFTYFYHMVSHFLAISPA
ncbi:MAG TPA: hypothetical protein VF677_03150 [Flavobacterium sp.]